MTTRLVIFHDYFGIRGGGERLVLTLARATHATLVYGYRTDESFDETYFPSETRSLGLSRRFRRLGLHIPILTAAFRRERRWARRFPLRLFSGVMSPFSAPDRSASGINIYYCHTPPRFLFDQRESTLARQNRLRRVIARPFMAAFERSYRRAVQRMDMIATNSENTRARIKTYLGRESVVIYPPIDTHQFSWLAPGSYYVSTARLSPLKRVDKIVEAFLGMPEKQLVVVSGGEESERLRRLAANAPNIQFRGWVSDAELAEVIGRSIATIYLPKDEDFGMSPIESMAAGKPVIGVAEGGLLESIRDGMTGTLLDPDFTSRDIARAVMAMTPEKAASMRSACEERALAFSESHFLHRMASLFETAERQAQRSSSKAPFGG